MFLGILMGFIRCPVPEVGRVELKTKTPGMQAKLQTLKKLNGSFDKRGDGETIEGLFVGIKMRNGKLREDLHDPLPFPM